jgi:hypothetical protein
VTVYTSALPANGMEYDYDLSGIGDGLFRLVQRCRTLIHLIRKS